MKLVDNAIVDVAVIPSGSLGLDVALGIGGYPRGRVIEIYGPESSGKTTLAIHAIAEAQKAGGIAAFIDAEHALDASYARALGVDIDNLLISQPDTGEQALEITETLVRSGAVDVVVIDSVAALTPKSEIEGDMGDSHMGLQARLMSQALRKLTAIISKSKTAVIFINQIRMKIGVMFGNPETTPGGNALKFYATIRLDIRGIAAIKDDQQVTGSRTRVRVVIYWPAGGIIGGVDPGTMGGTASARRECIPPPPPASAAGWLFILPGRGVGGSRPLPVPTGCGGVPLPFK